MNKFAKIIGEENTYGHNIPQGTIVEVIEDESTDEQPAYLVCYSRENQSDLSLWVHPTELEFIKD